MGDKFFYKLNHSVTGGAFIIAFFTIVSKLLGLIRERLIAANLGASELSDIYYAAFRLPDLIFNTLVLGALTSAFIPVFQKTWLKDKASGLNLANSVLNLFLLVIGALALIAWLAAPPLVAWTTPGFAAWQLSATVSLTRIMLLAIMFFVVSNVMGGILNSWKKFFSFSLAASLYNIGIILGITAYPYGGLNFLAWGVCLGAFLHLAVQLPEVYRNGWRYKFILNFSEGLKKILTLMLPRTIGLAAAQFNLIIVTVIASGLPAGSIAIFNLANNLQSLPISIFAVSLAVAVFPTFTEAWGLNDSKLFAQNFSLSVRRILFLLIPISVFILILRAQIVRVVLGTGRFDWEDTYYTAQTLGFFALSIFAQGLIPLLARSFYAAEDTRTPMLVGLLAMVINLGLSWYLGLALGVMGLALAFSIANIVNMILLYLLLGQRGHDIDHAQILRSILKISFNSLVAALVTYATLHLLANFVDMRTFAGIFLQGLGAGTLGLITYVVLGKALKLEEIYIVEKIISRFWRFLKNGKNT